MLTLLAAITTFISTTSGGLFASHTDATWPMLTLVAGFLLFHITEKLVFTHHAHEGDHPHGQRQKVGILSALALSGHSFFDGVGIGLAFQVSTQIGLTVALAVVAHDFSDGLNTVSLMLANGNSKRRTFKLLLLDATTPILGVLATVFFHFSDRLLLLYLGFFAGFLLYIGASNVLPEAHREKTSRTSLALTVVGVVFIFIVTRFSF
jgi:zinc transporter ZupT